MDELIIKTPNPICRLFFKIDLLTDFAADFIDWRYIHSWLVFSTQLVNCCLVDYILQELYTLFLTKLRTYIITSPSHAKMTSKYVRQGLVSLKFLRPWSSHY
jgi:hypothetical protein